MEITVTEAKKKLIALIRRATKGEDIIITKSGRRMARLVPISTPRKLGSDKELS